MMMTLDDVLHFIAQADDGQLNDMTAALSARYKALFPDWDVLYLAVPLNEPRRQEEILDRVWKLYKR